MDVVIVLDLEFLIDDDVIVGIIGSGDLCFDYDQVYFMVVNGDYLVVEVGFCMFLESYFDNELVLNVQYWFGESFLVQQNYCEVVDVFLKIYCDYLGNLKSVDSFLKFGVLLCGLGEMDVVCVIFFEFLNKFFNVVFVVLL